MSLDKRASSLLNEMKGKRPEIPVEYGTRTDIHMAEAAHVRKRVNKGAVEELVALEVGLNVDTVDKIMNGTIWPYAGGRLKKAQASGLHPANCFTANQREFVYGGVAVASDSLNPDEFKIFCDMSGLILSRALTMARGAKNGERPKEFGRIRKIIALSAEGTNLEELAEKVRG